MARLIEAKANTTLGSVRPAPLAPAAHKNEVDQISDLINQLDQDINNRVKWKSFT